MRFKGQYNTVRMQKSLKTRRKGKRGLNEVCDILIIVVLLALGGCQVPAKVALSLPSSAGQGKENISKGL